MFRIDADKNCFPRSLTIATVLGFVLASLAGLALSAQSAAAVDNGSLGIRPSNESDFFHLSILPGETIKATAIVSNHTAADVVLDTYAVDGLTTSAGAFALKAQNDQRTQVGSWTHDPATQITVAKHSQLAVPFTISVPLGTQPGDYSGGLIIQSPPLKGSTANSGGMPVRVDVVQRQGVRIYLTVAGKAIVSIAPGNLRWVKSAHSITFTIPITNTGNVTLHPTVTAGIDPLFGERRTVTFGAPESVPPGTTVMMTASYPASPLMQIAGVQATIKSAATTQHVSTTVFDVSWQILAALILLILTVSFGSWRFFRFLRKARIAIAHQHASTLTSRTVSDLANRENGDSVIDAAQNLHRDVPVSPRQ